MGRGKEKDGQQGSDGKTIVFVPGLAIGTLYYEPGSIADAAQVLKEIAPSPDAVFTNGAPLITTMYTRSRGTASIITAPKIDLVRSIASVGAPEVEPLVEYAGSTPIYYTYTHADIVNIQEEIDRKIDLLKQMKDEAKDREAALERGIRAASARIGATERRAKTIEKAYDKITESINAMNDYAAYLEGLKAGGVLPGELADAADKVTESVKAADADLKDLDKGNRQAEKELLRLREQLERMKAKQSDFVQTIETFTGNVREQRDKIFNSTDYNSEDPNAGVIPEAREFYASVLKSLFEGANFHRITTREAELDIGGYTVNVASTRKSLSSGVPTADEVTPSVKKANVQRQHGGMADLYATVGGGLCLDETVKGLTSSGQEKAVHMNAPPFLSYDKLNEAWLANIRNYDTGRIEAEAKSGVAYAGGLTVFHAADDGSYSTRFVSTDAVKRRAAGGSGGIFGGGVKIADLSDYHIGSFCAVGQESAVNLWRASQERILSAGLPQIVVLGGDFFQTGPYKEAPYEGHHFTKGQKDKAHKAVKANPDLTAEGRLDARDKMDEQFDSATPVSGVDEQIALVQSEMQPFMNEVVRNGGVIIITNGNHMVNSMYGKMQESQLLKGMVDEKYRHLVVAESEMALPDGAEYATVFNEGGYTGLAPRIMPDGTVSVEFWQGGSALDTLSIHYPHMNDSPENTPLASMKRTTSEGIVADVVIRGDKHHGGTGYAGNTIYLTSLAAQAPNNYTRNNSIQPSVRGYQELTVFGKDGDFEVEVVTEDVLSKQLGNRSLLQRKGGYSADALMG